MRQSQALKQTLLAHRIRNAQKKNPTKTFIGGMVIGVLSWELALHVTDIIIYLISK